jgi:hypothetical protein
MNRAEVVEIEDEEHVSIEYIDPNGNIRRKAIAYDDNFNRFNPENLLE